MTAGFNTVWHSCSPCSLQQMHAKRGYPSRRWLLLPVAATPVQQSGTFGLYKWSLRENIFGFPGKHIRFSRQRSWHKSLVVV